MTILAVTYLRAAGNDIGGFWDYSEQEQYPDNITSVANPFTTNFWYNQKFAGDLVYGGVSGPFDAPSVAAYGLQGDSNNREFWARFAYRQETTATYAVPPCILLKIFNETDGVKLELFRLEIVAVSVTETYLKGTLYNADGSTLESITSTYDLKQLPLIDTDCLVFDVNFCIDEALLVTNFFDLYAGSGTLLNTNAFANSAAMLPNIAVIGCPVSVIEPGTNKVTEAVFSVLADEETKEMFIVPLPAKANGELQEQTLGDYTDVQPKHYRLDTADVIDMSVTVNGLKSVTFVGQDAGDMTLPSSYEIKAIGVAACFEFVGAFQEIVSPILVLRDSVTNQITNRYTAFVGNDVGSVSNIKYQSRIALFNDTWNPVDLNTLEYGFQISL